VVSDEVSQALVPVTELAGLDPAPLSGAQLVLDVDAVSGAGAAGDHEEVPSALAPLPNTVTPLVPALSYSALELFERCPYRFRVERHAGLPGPVVGGVAAIGQAVHRAVEVGADADIARLVREADPLAGAAETAQAQGALARYLGSPLRARFAGAAEVRHEQPFVFTIGGAVISGRYDLSAVVDGRLVIGDLKVAALNGVTAEERRDASYAIQEEVYALAGLEAGFDEVTVLYQWLGDDDAATQLAERVFSAARRDDLRERMLERVRRALHGPWPARPDPLTCSGCPALGALCAGVVGEGSGDATRDPV
jgi:hypothetical protein